MIKKDLTTPSYEIKEEQMQYQKILRVRNESGTEDVYYSVFYEDLPDEFKETLEKTVGETASSKENGLRRLKDFMKKEELTATDDLLITVLRGCKYNLKKSETKLKSFLRSRQNIIKKLHRVDEEKAKLILGDGVISVLPYRDKLGRAVVVTKPTMNLEQYSTDDVEAVAMSLILYLLTFPLTDACGLIYIAECKCDSIFVFYPILRSFRPYVHYLLDIPLRMSRIDFVNENFLVRQFYNAVSFILPTKMTRRISFHGSSYERLNRVIPGDILPQDMEGKLGPMSNEFFRERLFKFIRTLNEEALQD